MAVGMAFGHLATLREADRIHARRFSMKTYTISTHRHDGEIVRTSVQARSEAEARAKFQSESTEWIVSLHEMLNP